MRVLMGLSLRFTQYIKQAPNRLTAAGPLMGRGEPVPGARTTLGGSGAVERESILKGARPSGENDYAVYLRTKCSASQVGGSSPDHGVGGGRCHNGDSLAPPLIRSAPSKWAPIRNAGIGANL